MRQSLHTATTALLLMLKSGLSSTGVFIVLLLFAFATVAAQEDTSMQGGILGEVVYPDGRPVAAATVKATTACPGDRASLMDQVITSEDGHFYISPKRLSAFGCRRVRLTARKDLWLETGDDPYYGKRIGKAPIVELASTGSPQRALIQLGEQGGELVIRVWDKATQRFIRAELTLRLLPKRGHIVMNATGRDGSPISMLLPAGEHEVYVSQFDCKGQDYFVAHPFKEKVKIGAGETFAHDITVDVRRMKPRASYNNPAGSFCSP